MHGIWNLEMCSHVDLKNIVYKDFMGLYTDYFKKIGENENWTIVKRLNVNLYVMSDNHHIRP